MSKSKELTNNGYILDPMFLDLESTRLDGSFGHLISSAVVYGSSDTVTAISIGDAKRDVCNLKGMAACRKGFCDRRLSLWTKEKVENADFIVGWNSKLFDIPLLNTRLILHNERPVFPTMHLDLMYTAGWGSARFYSRRLDAVARSLNVPNEKTSLDVVTWRAAGDGNPRAIAEIVKHNKLDVLVTRDCFLHLKPLVKSLHR